MFKKLFSFLIVLSMTLVLFTGVQISVSAEESGAGWSLDDNGKLTVTTNDGTTAWRNTISDKTTVTSVVIESGVTSISNFAFYECSSLTSVTIPNGVTSIGQAAFSNCTSLRSIEIPNSVGNIGVYAFYNCTSLSQIIYEKDLNVSNADIPDTTTHIKYEVNNDGTYEITDIKLGEGKAPVVIDENKYTYDKTDTDLMKKIAHAHDYAEGACTKCGVADPNAGTTVTTPTETEPTVTNPTGSSSAETDTTVTIPTVTDPTVTAPTVTDPAGADIVSIPKSELNKILTPEEIANGVTVTTEISEDVPDSDKSKVSALLGQNETAGLFLDITLYKNDSGILTPVTEIKNNEIAITVRIPDSIYTPERTYFAVRVHNGEAKKLVSVYDRESRLLTFYTNLFSTYAIAWTEPNAGIGSPVIPSYPTNTETTVTTAEKITADGDYTGEDISAGAADDSDDGGIEDMSMVVLVIAVAAAVSAAVLIKKIVF